MPTEALRIGKTISKLDILAVDLMDGRPRGLLLRSRKCFCRELVEALLPQVARVVELEEKSEMLTGAAKRPSALLHTLGVYSASSQARIVLVAEALPLASAKVQT